jgi:hypothetical protein
MSGDQTLRRRLRDVDPARPGGPMSSQQSPSAQDLRERAMRIADRHDSTTTDPARTAAAHDDPGRAPRRPWLVAGAAAAVAAVAVGGGLALSGALGSQDTPAPASTLALTAAPSDVAGSCLAFDVGVLAGMPTALAGTVTAVEDGTASVEVERWYRGGDADVVTVSAGEERVALDGLELVAGEEYLITASQDGTVNGCGFSGPATPELRAAFDQAFGG